MGSKNKAYMNNVVANFNKLILPFAQNYGLPPGKKRAILREYLQVKILALIYQEKISKDLFFVGGTSLRLLHNLNRFSEDLDFDSLKLTVVEISRLIKTVVSKLASETINVDLYHNRTDRRDYFEFRFPKLLYDLNLSRNNDEKLVIKFDFEKWWQGQKRESVFLNRYGFLANIVTKTKDQILVEKLVAYLERQETQPRDIYDIVWLIAGGSKPDLDFARKNKLSSNLVQLAQKKFTKEKNRLNTFKTKLSPFLLDEKDTHQLDFFGQILEGINK